MDVSNSRFGVEFFDTIVMHCQDRLEYLKLDNSLQINGELIRQVGSFQKLQYLSIAHIQDVKDDDIISVMNDIGCRLKGISLAGCHELTDQSLVSLRGNCRELMELTFHQYQT